MSSGGTALVRAPTPGGHCANAREISQRVDLVLAAMAPTDETPQRRQSQRFPFPQLIKLEPVDVATMAPQDDPVVVVGKHISAEGLGFFHRDPLPHRYVVAQIGEQGTSAVRLLLDVSWCRFTRHGWYESGGKFVRVLS